jgi:hypothetical protein
MTKLTNVTLQSELLRALLATIPLRRPWHARPRRRQGSASAATTTAHISLERQHAHIPTSTHLFPIPGPTTGIPTSFAVLLPCLPAEPVLWRRLALQLGLRRERASAVRQVPHHVSARGRRGC